jgi:hypothetical protein
LWPSAETLKYNAHLVMVSPLAVRPVFRFSGMPLTLTLTSNGHRSCRPFCLSSTATLSLISVFSPRFYYPNSALGLFKRFVYQTKWAVLRRCEHRVEGLRRASITYRGQTMWRN